MTTIDTNLPRIVGEAAPAQNIDARRDRDARREWRYSGQGNDAMLIFGALGLAYLADPFGMGGTSEAVAAQTRMGEAGFGPSNGFASPALGSEIAAPAMAASGLPSIAGGLPTDIGFPAAASGFGQFGAYAANDPTPAAAFAIGAGAGAMVSLGGGGSAFHATFAAVSMAPLGAAPIHASPTIVLSPTTIVQVNVSASDHAAEATAIAITHIETITDSIVFIGGNTAIASAINFAPVMQSNGLYGASDPAGGGGGYALQMYQQNIAFMDTDAVAIAISATIIGSAVNSVVVMLGNTAHAGALNIAPLNQENSVTNKFGAFDDTAFGALHEAQLPRPEDMAEVRTASDELFGKTLGSVLDAAYLEANGLAEILGALPPDAVAQSGYEGELAGFQDIVQA
jgi:hypothetical protein